jgi:Ca2+-binding RTX toxin-like protein
MISSTAAPATIISTDGEGSDVIFGGAGNDTIYLSDESGERDRVFAGPGDDTINVDNGDTDDGAGPDIIDCGPGNDTVNLNGNTGITTVNCETVNP